MIQQSFKYGLWILICSILITVACTKPADESPKIIQSNLVYEDNVNGRTPPPNNVIESVNFFYNENGRLISATVYDDTTTTAHLLKEIDLTYLSDKIVVDSYLDTIGDVTYYIGFNEKKQVTTITLPDSGGLYISYLNDRISNIKILPGNDEYLNFIYDDNDNLLQYELKIGNQIAGRAVLEYDNQLVSSEFDSRFLTKEIKFIYLGGLDLMMKLGLNYGKVSKNRLIRRTEIIAATGDVNEQYNYGYTFNNNLEITKRNIRFSTDTLFYQFKY